MRTTSIALWLCAESVAGCAVSTMAVCVPPIQSVDQVDAGVALLVGPGPDDVSWSTATGLREGMVLSRGVPSESCRVRFTARLERLRGGLEGEFHISE